MPARVQVVSAIRGDLRELTRSPVRLRAEPIPRMGLHRGITERLRHRGWDVDRAVTSVPWPGPPSVDARSASRHAGRCVPRSQDAWAAAAPPLGAPACAHASRERQAEDASTTAKRLGSQCLGLGQPVEVVLNSATAASKRRSNPALWHSPGALAFVVMGPARSQPRAPVTSTIARWSSRSGVSLLLPFSARSSSASRVTTPASSSGEKLSAWAKSFSA